MRELQIRRLASRWVRWTPIVLWILAILSLIFFLVVNFAMDDNDLWYNATITLEMVAAAAFVGSMPWCILRFSKCIFDRAIADYEKWLSERLGNLY
jgi:hypothetical protein